MCWKEGVVYKDEKENHNMLTGHSCTPALVGFGDSHHL